MIVVTGVAPATGEVTPGIAAMVITAAVAGNTAVTTPELARFVAGAEVPATVKKFAVTPVRVKPGFCRQGDGRCVDHRTSEWAGSR